MSKADLTIRNAAHYNRALAKLTARCQRLEYRLNKLDADFRLKALARDVKALQKLLRTDA